MYKLFNWNHSHTIINTLHITSTVTVTTIIIAIIIPTTTTIIIIIAIVVVITTIASLLLLSLGMKTRWGEVRSWVTRPWPAGALIILPHTHLAPRPVPTLQDPNPSRIYLKYKII